MSRSEALRADAKRGGGKTQLPEKTIDMHETTRDSRDVPQFHAPCKNFSFLRVSLIVHTGASRGANTQPFPESTHELALLAFSP